MLICPLRFPFKASSRFPGGTFRSSNRPAMSNCLNFLRAISSNDENRRTR